MQFRLSRSLAQVWPAPESGGEFAEAEPDLDLPNFVADGFMKDGLGEPLSEIRLIVGISSLRLVGGIWGTLSMEPWGVMNGVDAGDNSGLDREMGCECAELWVEPFAYALELDMPELSRCCSTDAMYRSASNSVLLYDFPFCVLRQGSLQIHPSRLETSCIKPTMLT